MARTKQRRRDISRPPLHDACARGNVEEVLALLQQEGRHQRNQVNMRDAPNDGTTPLHVAVMHGAIKVARLLLNHGANINSKDNFGRTPIAFIAANNNQHSADMIELLTEHGAKPQGAQLIEACCRQHNVCNKDLIGVIQALVKDVNDMPAFINYQDRSGYTALHYVCERGYFDVARLLLQHGADWTITNIRGQTPVEFLQRKLLTDDDDKIQSANQAKDLLDLVEKKDALYEQLVKHAEEGDLTSATYLLETQGALPDPVFLKHSSSDDDPKMTPLMHAVSSNNIPFAKVLLKHRANVNSHGRCFHHEPPLIMAIQKNYFEMFELLLGPDGRADPNVEGCYGCRTPLHIACEQGLFQMAKKLIDKGANVRAKTDNSSGGSTPLHWAASCRTSPEDGNAKAKLIKLLLDNHADPNALDFDGDETALHMIAHRGRCITPEDQEHNDQDDYVTCEAIVHSFIEAGADLNRRDDISNTAPLTSAVNCKNFNFAKALLRHNCDISLISSTDHYASNLHVVCGCLNDEMRTLDLIKVMIEERHFKIHNNEVHNNEDNTLLSTSLHYPLHQAAYAGNYHIVKYLLSKGANIVATNDHGETCIDMARAEYHDNNFSQDKSPLAQVLERTVELVRSCQSGKVDQIQNALTSTSEDIFVQVKIPGVEGNFLIHQVVRFGLLDATQYLVNRGADLNTKRDLDGKTPLNIAMDYGHSAIVGWIKSYNISSCVNASQSGVNNKANQIFEAIEQGDCSVISKIQRLLENGELDVNSRDKYSSSRTLLHAAALYGEEDVVRLLLHHGADVNLCNTWGHSPLHASARGSFAVTRQLLTCGQTIDVDKTDDFDNTALHIASSLRHARSAKILLANGANILARNFHGLTPVELTRHRDYHGEGLAWSHTLLLVKAAQQEDVDQIEKFSSEEVLFVQVKIPDDHKSKESLTWDAFIAKTVHFVNACLLSGDFDEVEKYHHVDIFAMEEHPEKSGEFLFSCICRLGLLEVAKRLYQRGANPNSTRDDGRTALSLAAKQGDIDMVRWLICDVGVNTSTADIWGNTPLHLACREGNTEIVSFMVANCSKKEGFDIIAKNWLGQTPRDIAQKYHQHDIIALFDTVLKV